MFESVSESEELPRMFSEASRASQRSQARQASQLVCAAMFCYLLLLVAVLLPFASLCRK